MKRLSFFLIALFLLFSLSTYAYASEKGSGCGHETMHKMSDTSRMDHSGEMIHEHQGEMGETHMMREKEMQQKMAPCIGKLQNMMQHMNKMLEKEMNSQTRARLVESMKNVSKHMMDMSSMMERGYCTLEEMDKISEEVSETEEQFRELEDYL